MKKILFFIYGVTAYLLFNIVLFYFVGFLGNWLVPKTIDSGPESTLGSALLINSLLIILFGLQHSMMARPVFKQLWLKTVPIPIERSTYVLFSCLALSLLGWLWQPLPTVIWQIENPFGYFTLWGLFGLGWLLSLYATFLVDHFDLFGLRQVYLYLMGLPYVPVPFKEQSIYRYIRHPIMLGILIGFWATPTMTLGHLLLAGGFSLYIFIGIRLEEQDMQRTHGKHYEKYQQKTSMIMPSWGKFFTSP